MAVTQPNMMSLGFYKVYTAQHCYYKLEIPNDFVAKMSRTPQMVLLDTRMGKLWHVELVSTNEGCFFHNGWQRFVKDNRIILGDILVFQYDGRGLFTVSNLGSSGCLKKDNNSRIHIRIENVMPYDYEVKREKEESEQDDNDVIIIDDDSYDDGDSGDDSEGCKEEVVQEEEKKEEEVTAVTTSQRRRSKTFSRNNGGSKKKAAAEVGGSHKGANDDLKGIDVRKYIQPGNPYFVRNSSRCKNSSLLVPAAVLKDFGIELTESVSFCDEFGRKWPGKVAYWKDGRTIIHGWRSFCRGNHVHKDDIYICEFPQKRGRRHNLIKVHIVRGVGSQSKTKN